LHKEKLKNIFTNVQNPLLDIYKKSSKADILY